MARLEGQVVGSIVVAIGAALALLPALWWSGSPMDEGMVLAYPARVLDGAVPYRDFQSFYGPGNLWVIAAAFRLFGVAQDVERVVGIGYVVAAAVSMYFVVRRFDRPAALAAAAVVLSIATTDGIRASATWGGVGFLTASIAVGSGHGRARSLGAGVLAGCAVLYRFDFVLPVVLAHLTLARSYSTREKRRFISALALIACLYAPYLILSGTSGISRTLGGLIASSSGRRLPIPGPADYPQGLLLYAGIAATAFGVATAAANRGLPPARRGELMAFGMAAVGMLPYALSRADTSHVAPLAVLACSLVPAAVRLGAGEIARLVRAAAVAVVCALLIVTVGPFGTGLVLTDIAALVGRPLSGYRVENEGRSFMIGTRSEAAGVQRVISSLEHVARTGDRLFVGPYDLRRTWNGPTYLYFLFPHLKPASYYMEFNPWTANRPGSGLARDVASADWLILDDEWDHRYEPNASRRRGSPWPNRVVRTRFCLMLRAGHYRLYGNRRSFKAGTCAGHSSDSATTPSDVGSAPDVRR